LGDIEVLVKVGAGEARECNFSSVSERDSLRRSLAPWICAGAIKRENIEDADES
jgi:hypothetical protein